MPRKPLRFSRRLNDLAWAARQIKTDEAQRLAEELERLFVVANQVDKQMDQMDEL